jgi:hypothetical protein
MRKAVRTQTRLLLDRADEAAASLRREIAAPAAHGSPAILMLMGLPGAGKSHCARLLAARLGAVHVASDELRTRLFVATAYTKEENAALFRIVGGLIDALLGEGHRVIIDATHLRARYRSGTEALAARRGVPLAHVLVASEESDTLARLARRRSARAADDRSEADERVYAAMRARGLEEPPAYLTLRNGPEVAAEVARIADELERRWCAAT